MTCCGTSFPRLQPGHGRSEEVGPVPKEYVHQTDTEKGWGGFIRCQRGPELCYHHQ